MLSLLLQGENGLDGGVEDVKVIARYAVEAIGSGEVLDYLQLLVDTFATVFDQEIHHNCREVIRIELWSLPADWSIVSFDIFYDFL